MRGGQTTSREFSDWCESQTSDLAFAVQTEQKDRADLFAEFGATREAMCTEIDDLARSGATSDADPKAARAIRKKERWSQRVCE